MEPLQAVTLLLWGTVVGVDLVTGPQFMVARPLVAGTVAGTLLGDPVSGAAVGAILELFALEVLPVGAARYPDYGPGAVAAAWVTAGAPDVLGLGLGVAVGLVVAHAGEQSMTVLRRLNTESARRYATALDAGTPGIVSRVHRTGVARDALRSLLVTGGGLVLATLIRWWPPVTLRGAVGITAVIVGIALASAASAAVRASVPPRGLAWLAGGLTGGTLWVILR